MTKQIKCGNCGGDDHNRRSCKKPTTQASETHVMSWHVYKDAAYWAPYGDNAWSAVIITKVGRVWARGQRVKPRTGVVVTEKARVRMDELIKRDPGLTGTDRPEVPPVEFFAKYRAGKARVEQLEKESRMTKPETIETKPAPTQPAEKDTSTESQRIERATKLFSLFGEATDDDW